PAVPETMVPPLPVVPAVPTGLTPAAPELEPPRPPPPLDRPTPLSDSNPQDAQRSAPPVQPRAGTAATRATISQRGLNKLGIPRSIAAWGAALPLKTKVLPLRTPGSSFDTIARQLKRASRRPSHHER